MLSGRSSPDRHSMGVFILDDDGKGGLLVRDGPVGVKHGHHHDGGDDEKGFKHPDSVEM